MPAIIYKNKNGDRIPSQSAIGNQWGEGAIGLQYWYWDKGRKGLGFNEMPEANIGTIAHNMIDCDAKNKPINLENHPIEHVIKAKQCFENWEEWKKQVNFKSIETEISLVSEEHQFGGTIDCICEINNKLSILDVKTGKDIYASQVVQITCYAHLWEENMPKHPLIGGYHIVRTGKEIASFTHAWYAEFPMAWEVFLHLRKLYDLAKEINKLK